MIICEFCGEEKHEDIFVIGASLSPDWCMIYGTGKMACPDCYEMGQNEAADVISGHICTISGVK